MQTDTSNTADRLQALIVSLHRSGITCSEATQVFKKRFLLVVLSECNGNQCRAARELGIHRNTLSRHIDELGIDVRAVRQASKPKPVRRAVHSTAVQISA